MPVSGLTDNHRLKRFRHGENLSSPSAHIGCGHAQKAVSRTAPSTRGFVARAKARIINELKNSRKNHPGKQNKPAAWEGLSGQLLQDSVYNYTRALLLEMMYADFVVVPEERQTVTESLKCHFNLAEEELDKLLRNAEDQALGSLGWQSHLVPINELMTRQQKAQLLRCLWQLAQVDSSVHVMENAMLEQLARDMHIEPAELDEIRRASALKRKAPNTSA